MYLVPKLLISLTLSNIGYLSLISLIPNVPLSTGIVIILRLVMLSVSWWICTLLMNFEKTPKRGSEYLVLLPYLLIWILRFPLIYPTYDDLAVHFAYGDLANRLWQNQNYMPLELLNYFYLPYDLSYTPLLYTLGIRLTIAIYYLANTWWLWTLYRRISASQNNPLTRLLVAITFSMIPMIPHMVAISGTLMLEFYTLPLIIEAWWQITRPKGKLTGAVLLVLIALLVKHSQALFIAPILLYHVWYGRERVNWKWVVGITAWSSIFFWRLWAETGNPLGGLFNGVFRSALWGLTNFTQPLFGPENWWQTLIWPIWGQFTERYAEGIVAGLAKIVFAPIPIIGYLVSIYLMIRNKSGKYASIVIGYLIWSYMVGYARYYIPLNLLALLTIIVDVKLVATVRHARLLFGLILIFIMSSYKTDFSWRPAPSFRTPAANDYFWQKYREGLALVGRDRVGSMALAYKAQLAPYEAVVTIYRGPYTMLSYMAYLNDAQIGSGVTEQGFKAVMADQKVSSSIKDNLTKLVTARKVLVLVDPVWKDQVDNVYFADQHVCTQLGNAPSEKVFQRPDYYGNSLMYECTLRKL